MFAAALLARFGIRYSVRWVLSLETGREELVIDVWPK